MLFVDVNDTADTPLEVGCILLRFLYEFLGYVWRVFLRTVSCNEIGGTCGADREGERRVQGFDGETFRKRDHWGDTGVDGRIILILIFRKWGMDWIELAQDRDRWRALVNVKVNLRVQ
jgi:hypothetical protein